MLQVGFRIYPVQFACLDQAVHHRTSVTTMIITEEQPVLFSLADGTEGSFDGVIMCALQGTHNNVCERAIKTVVMGRKSWLFAGSRMAGERAARIMSLLETAKLNGLEPHAWLTDVLNRLPLWPEDRLEELLPLPGFTFSA